MAVEHRYILVLAGNRQQFEHWLDEKGLTDTDARHGYEPRVIMGNRYSAVIEIGTFWERKDARKLRNFVKDYTGI